MMKKMNLRGASWDSLFLTFVKIVTTLSTIIFNKMLSTGLSLNEYGTYSQAIIVTSIGTSVIIFGLGDALNFFYNKHGHSSKEERISYVNTIYFIEIVLGIILSAGIVLFSPIISGYFSNAALGTILVIVSIKPLIDNVLFLYQVLYVSVGKAKIIAIRNFVVVVLKLTLMYLSIYVFKSIAAIFLSLLFIELLQLAFFAVVFAKGSFFVNPFRFSGKKILSILSYGLPMGVFAMTSVLSRDIDKLVVGRLTNSEILAIYTNCSKILPFDIISASFAVVLIPYIMKYVSSGDVKNGVALFKNYLKIGYFSVWIFGVAVIIISPQIIPFLYSDEFLVGQNVFVCYVIDSMLRFASMHLVLTSGGKTKTLMTYSIVSMILNLILNIVLYNWIGILGPAIATLITTTLYMFAILHKTIGILRVRWLDVFDVKEILIYVAILAVTGVSFYFINQQLLYWGMWRYIAMFISAGGFCLVNLLINLKKIRLALTNINQLKLN